MLGRTYITLEALDILDENHTRVFRAVHDQRKQFLTAEMMADFIDGNGTDRDTFLEKFNSSEIRTAAAKMDSETRRYGVNSVPTLIVGGKYIVNMGLGRKLALDIVNHLVLKIQADETAATAG